MQSIRFNLFNDENDQVLYDGIVQHGPTEDPSGFTVYTGTLQLSQGERRNKDILDSSFSIVGEKGSIALNVIAPEGVFQILPVNEGLYVVEQLDPSARFKDEAVSRLPKRTATLAERKSATRDDGRQVDVIVVYTTRAMQHFGSKQAIDARADLAAQLTNEAFANSAIDLKVRLVDKQEIPWFQESYSFSSTLDRISNDVDTARLRNQYHADQVTLIRWR